VHATGGSAELIGFANDSSINKRFYLSINLGYSELTNKIEARTTDSGMQNHNILLHKETSR
ncbi:MAG: hypothetical protein WBO06_04705, partial [Gammaproteobacteria bacterium]